MKKRATEASDQMHELRGLVGGEALVTSKAPLFRYMKSTGDGHIEITMGPSLAWAVVAILTLLLKGPTLLPMLWKVLP
jgi:hypothetical protein